MTTSPIPSPILEKARQAPGGGSKHCVCILDKGDEALLARIHLIRAARTSIDIQTFIWKNDHVGLKVLDELFQAALRGVQVRILVDDWILNEELALLDYFNPNHKNFEVKVYNPPSKRIKYNFLQFIGKVLIDFRGLNQRMHNKVFIVDEEVAIVGGRNYDNTYYDRGEARNFLDIDLMVQGPTLEDISYSFEEYYYNKQSVRVLDFKDVEGNSLQGSYDLLREARAKGDCQLFEALDARADDTKFIQRQFVERSFEVKDMTFVYDRPTKFIDRRDTLSNVTTSALRTIINDAERSIMVQSPYFVLSKDAVEMIRKLREKRPGLEFIVSTNSLAATDNLYAYAFLYKEKKIYIKDLKIRIHELKPLPGDMKDLINTDLPPANCEEAVSHMVFGEKETLLHKGQFLCIHAKIFLIDDELAWVGTFNADIRSEKINTEVALVIKDKRINAILKEKFNKVINDRNSWIVGPKKYVPGLTEISDELATLSEKFPLIDLWPFRNVTCFEKLPKKKERHIFDKDFYEHYRDVGPFPGTHHAVDEREVKVHLLQMFGQVVKSII